MAKHFNIDTNYGIEIEFLTSLSSGEIANLITATGIDCRAAGYTHATTPYWKIVSDASVHGGWELVSPILNGDEGFRQLKLACDALDAAGCRVNKSCGVHVHLDARSEDFGTIQRFTMNYAKMEDCIDILQPHSRRASNNHLIQSLSHVRHDDSEARQVQKINSTIDAIRSCRSVSDIVSLFGTRYRKINLESYTRHGTVEIRQHSGSLDAEKIEHWVRLMGALFAASRASRSVAKRRVNGQTSHFRLKWLFEMTMQGATRKYMGKRARQLNTTRTTTARTA